jgi:hypothetical protein
MPGMSAGMGSAVSVAFGKASADNRAALVGYLPAGFPSVSGAIEAAQAMAQAGADIIEVGLPYSDPLMDGPVIAEAVHRALAAPGLRPPTSMTWTGCSWWRRVRWTSGWRWSPEPAAGSSTPPR